MGARANLPYPSRLANIAAVNQLVRIPKAAVLLIASTTMTALGQAESPAEALAKAEADYTATLKSEPDNASLYNQRGVVRFFQLKFTTSLADFDKFIEMTPSREPYH